jgi:hypothetical protein
MLGDITLVREQSLFKIKWGTCNSIMDRDVLKVEDLEHVLKFGDKGFL